MSLRLVIESSPHRQPRPEVAHGGGELSIGRGPGADWQVEDPDQFISRRHAVVSGEAGRWTVTDVSKGGLFVDGAEAPLGAGASRELRDGMRLRMGDIVIRVDIAAPALAQPQSGGQQAAASPFAADDFFAQARTPPPPPPPRPAGLPEPFESPRAVERGSPRRAPPVEFDDPFGLGPAPSSGPSSAPSSGPAAAEPWPAPRPEPRRESRAEPPAAPQPTPSAEPAGGFGSFFDAPAPPPAPAPTPSAPRAPASQARPAGAPAGLVEALLAGMGLDPAEARDMGPAEMEALGRRFRALVEGLHLTLRSRAREKQNLRVAQTVIGSAEVNPLKFLPTTDEVVGALVGPPKPGYLDADAAIAAAQRDVADHQMRSWQGLQAALRRMIDRFDPEEIEKEQEAAGRLRALLAGGRNALLWQLYRERYASIAKAAEERFLGEVGSDFREAYEGSRRKGHD